MQAEAKNIGTLAGKLVTGSLLLLRLSYPAILATTELPIHGHNTVTRNNV
jgi:hypothetical protein